MKFEKVSYEQFEKDFPLDWDYEERGIYNAITLPKRATTYSAGYDFYSPIDFDLKPGQSIKIPTGIKVQLEGGLFLLIVPRSGLGFKYKVQLWNTCGVIDADYYDNISNEGHIWVKLYNDSPEGETIHIKQGDAICQGIAMSYFIAEDDNVRQGRNGGFGSTSK